MPLALRVSAKLFVGQFFDGSGKQHDGHAWVVFEESGERFVLEAVIKDETAMIRRLPDVCTEYVPHFSVDATFTMRSHAGYLLYLKQHERSRGALGDEIRGQRTQDNE